MMKWRLEVMTSRNPNECFSPSPPLLLQRSCLPRRKTDPSSPSRKKLTDAHRLCSVLKRASPLRRDDGRLSALRLNSLISLACPACLSDCSISLQPLFVPARTQAPISDKAPLALRFPLSCPAPDAHLASAFAVLYLSPPTPQQILANHRVRRSSVDLPTAGPAHS